LDIDFAINERQDCKIGTIGTDGKGRGNGGIK
jgi:hypothetical protein